MNKSAIADLQPALILVDTCDFPADAHDPMQLLKRCSISVVSALAAVVFLVSSGSAASAPADSFYAVFNDRPFVDQDNAPFDTDSLRNKLTLFNFFFTGCSTVCPMQTAQLASVMRQLPTALRSQVQFVSVTLQPLVDTPQKLSEFRNRFQLDHENWQFLVGGLEDTRMLSEDLQLIASDSTGDQIDHRTELWLVNRQGMLVQQYHGNAVDVPRIVMELQQLSQLNPASHAN